MPPTLDRRDTVFHTNRRRKARKKNPSAPQRLPRAVQHRVELLVVSGKVQYGAADDDVREPVWKGQGLERFDAEVVGRESRREVAGNPPNLGYGLGIGIGPKNVESLLQKEGQIAPVSTPGVQNRVTVRDSATQQLVKDVDVDLPELTLEIHLVECPDDL